MSARLSTIKPLEMVRALQRAGFFIHRQKGSHVFMKHADGRWTTVPMHVIDLRRGTVQGILHHAGITAEQLIDLL